MEFLDKLPIQDEKLFAQIREKLANRAGKYLRHGSVSQEIINRIVLSLLSEKVDEVQIDAWLNSKVEQETENYVRELWDKTYYYSLSLTGDPDKAADVAQSALTAFLTSKEQIQYVNGWLQRTAHNLAMKSFRNEAKQARIKHDLDIEQEAAAQFFDTDPLNWRKRITNKDVRRILDKDEVREWKAMNKAKTLKDYAMDTGQNYNQVRKRKHILIKKIKSGYLRLQGWMDTPEILDYQTLMNIKRFIATLIDTAKDSSIRDIYRYCPPTLRAQLDASLEGMREVYDWGIFMVSSGVYKVCIVDATRGGIPKLVMITIKINRSNQIRIMHSVVPEYEGSAPEEIVEPLPMEKGRCTFSIADIKRLIG